MGILVPFNTYQVVKGTKIPMRVYELIQEIVSLGKADNPTRFYVDNDRRAYYRTIDTTPEYYSRGGKLYTSAFYRLLEKRLSARGLIVVQSTSPLYARQSYWCVVTTLESVGFKTAPYHALVPSFGEWGYIIAGRQEFVIPTVDRKKTRFLTSEILPGLFEFPADMARVPAEVNQLNNQVLVRTFEAEWRKLVR